MKKKFIGGIALLTIALSFVFAMNLKALSNGDEYEVDTSEMLKEDKDGGTPVSKCYKDGTSDPGLGKFYIKCNSQTSNSMIYPCPAPTEGNASQFGASQCTTDN